MSKDLPVLPTIIVCFLGLVYLLWRVVRVPERVKNRNNRYLTYIGFLVPSCLLFGILGTLSRNNWIYYGASLSVEAVIYCFLAWYSLAFKPLEKPKAITRPGVAVGFILANIIELTCFYLSGDAMANISTAQPLELNQSFWLCVAVCSSVVYIIINSLLLILELRKGIETATTSILRYRCSSFAFIALMFFLWSALVLIGLITYYMFSIRAIEQAMSDLGVFLLLILVILYAMVLIFDKKAFQRFEITVEPVLVKWKIRKLEWFYNYAIKAFPEDNYSNPFSLTTLSIEQAPGWMLRLVVLELINVRILLLIANALLDGNEDMKSFNLNVSKNTELAIWRKFFTSPDDVEAAKLLAHKISPSAYLPDGDSSNIEQETTLFLWLSQTLRKELKA